DDGLDDGVEVAPGGTDPVDADTDDDGLEDGTETNTTHTDPTVDDQDANPVPDPGGDTDHDGVNNGDQANTGTNPTYPDTDDDGMPDGTEEHTTHTDPTVKDTDKDGIVDGKELGNAAYVVAAHPLPRTGSNTRALAVDAIAVVTLGYALRLLSR